MTGEIPDIHTAGYGNRGFDAFIELMRAFGITHLVDIRSVPQSSYWEDFRKERLERIVPPTGLSYVYMGDTLGGAENSPVLCKDPSALDHVPMLNSPKLQLGIETVLRAATKPGRKLCLMCGCKRPHQCHRNRLLGTAFLGIGIELQHIDADDTVRSQSQVAAEYAGFQQSLF